MIRLYPIETHSWVAIDLTDNFIEKNTTSPNNIGSIYCRQLLKKVQQQLKLTGKLMDSAFPYFFETSNQQRWYVSFSHSHQHVAVLISQYPRIGIDVEDGTISEKVAIRFFSKNECKWLANQPVSNQKKLRKLFWCLKESYIKTHQNNDQQLIKELKKDLFQELTMQELLSLINETEAEKEAKSINLIIDRKKIIGSFNTQPCSFVILK